MGKYNYDYSNFFTFNFDLNYILRTSWLRFQRQVTTTQLKVMREYKKVIRINKADTKIAYELDDIVHAIEMSNIVAYQFYTDIRRRNLIEAMKMSDVVTFSTDFLKSFYQDKFNITNSRVIPNFLPRYLWGDKGKRDKYNKGKKGKMRILWAGSASHVGKNGDLDFLYPLIKKTQREFEWVFFGVMPPALSKEKFEYHEWSDIWSYPHAIDQIDADIAICPIRDTVFNYGKSDLKLLEYSALGLPSVCSSVGDGQGPYDMIDGICTLENDADVWYQSIKEMAADPAKRVEYLEAGQTELNDRWLEDEKNIGIYLDIYK